MPLRTIAYRSFNLGYSSYPMHLVCLINSNLFFKANMDFSSSRNPSLTPSSQDHTFLLLHLTHYNAIMYLYVFSSGTRSLRANTAAYSPVILQLLKLFLAENRCHKCLLNCTKSTEKMRLCLGMGKEKCRNSSKRSFSYP